MLKFLYKKSEENLFFHTLSYNKEKDDNENLSQNNVNIGPEKSPISEAVKEEPNTGNLLRDTPYTIIDGSSSQDLSFIDADKVLVNNPKDSENLEFKKEPEAEASKLDPNSENERNPYLSENQIGIEDSERKKLVQGERVGLESSGPTLQASQEKKSRFPSADITGLSAEVKVDPNFPASSAVKVANHLKHYSSPKEFKRRKESSDEQKSKKYKSKKIKDGSDSESKEITRRFSNQVPGSGYGTKRHSKLSAKRKKHEKGDMKWREGGQRWRSQPKWESTVRPTDVEELSQPKALPVKEEVLAANAVTTPGPSMGAAAQPNPSPPQDYETFPKVEKPIDGKDTQNLTLNKEATTSPTPPTASLTNSSSLGPSNVSSSTSTQPSASAEINKNQPEATTTVQLSSSTTATTLPTTTTSAPTTITPTSVSKSTSIEALNSTQTSSSPGSQGNDLSNKEVNLHMGVTSTKSPASSHGPSIKKLLEQMKSQNKKDGDGGEKAIPNLLTTLLPTSMSNLIPPEQNMSEISKKMEGGETNKMIGTDINKGDLEKLQEGLLNQPQGRRFFSESEPRPIKPYPQKFNEKRKKYPQVRDFGEKLSRLSGSNEVSGKKNSAELRDELRRYKVSFCN